MLTFNRFVHASATVVAMTAINSASLGQSVINLPGDTTPGSARAGDQVNVGVGGSVGGFFRAFAGSEVNILGGSVGGAFTADVGSVVNLSSGDVGSSFGVGGVLNVSGGAVGSSFSALSGSEINLSGTSFTLGGNPIASLVQDQPVTISSRNTTLEGFFADGTPFAFDLNASRQSGEDFFDANATLTITVIPEPAALALLGVGCLMGLPRRRPQG